MEFRGIPGYSADRPLRLAVMASGAGMGNVCFSNDFSGLRKTIFFEGPFAVAIARLWLQEVRHARNTRISHGFLMGSSAIPVDPAGRLPRFAVRAAAVGTGNVCFPMIF